MAAPGHSSPPPPAAAAVLEFICLYTRDLRRKQKRWQDGRLTYHSFNKRIMVYDDRGNFVGDTHWHYDGDFDEGEEVELQRGGVMVQVQELTRRTNQDLTELLEKRVKEKEQRQMQAAARSPAAVATLPKSVARPAAPDQPQPRHRPLLQVIGTPSGHHGRAVVPRESPFEQRHQPAEAPDERAAKRRRFDEAPSSRSGHARALFGQALSLSATPTSSVPARREMAVATPKTVLREQPKTSSHFNRPVERERTVERGLDRPASYKDAANEDGPRPRHSKTCDPLQIGQIHERREVLSENDDIVEIDAPELARKESARPKRAEKYAPRATKAGKQPSLRPNTTLADHDSPRSTGMANEPQDRGSEKKRRPKRDENPVAPEQSKHLDPRSVTKQKLSDGSSSVQKIKESAPASMEKTPPEHVTELRIRSRKKRGLLMLSELPQKGHRQPEHATPATAAPERSTAEAVHEQRDRPQARSSQPTDEHEAQRVKKSQGDSIQRKISIELGEDDDPFRSPSPRPQDLLDAGTGGLSEDEAETAKVRVSVQEVANDKLDTEVESQMDTEKGRATDYDGPTPILGDARVPPPERPYDPYQMPSSSLEEHSTTLSCLAPGAPMESNVLRDQTTISSLNDPDAMEPVNLTKKTAKGRAARKSRRKIIVDDEDEEDRPFEAAQRTGTNVNKAVELSSDTQHSTSEYQRPPKKSTKAPKRKARVQRASEESDIETVDDEPARKEPARPNTTTRATRSKSRVHGNRSNLESAEGQPIERDSRATKTEMNSLLSEQEDLDEEPPSKRVRKENKSKASKSKPRLTRIKQNVKSRELIGFNLEALNVPLGLRGIGVPFRILSSPAEERTTIHYDGSLRTTDEAKKISAVQTSDGAGFPVVAAPIGGAESTGRRVQNGQVESPDRRPILAEHGMEIPSILMSGQDAAANFEDGSGSHSSAPSPDEPPTRSSRPERCLAFDGKHETPAKCPGRSSEVPQKTDMQESPPQIRPTDASMKEAAPTIREQALSAAEDPAIDPRYLRDTSGAAADITSTSIPASPVMAVQTMPPPAQKPGLVLQSQASNVTSKNATIGSFMTTGTTELCTIQKATAALLPQLSASTARTVPEATTPSVSSPAAIMEPDPPEAATDCAPKDDSLQNPTRVPTCQSDANTLVDKPTVGNTTGANLAESSRVLANPAGPVQQQKPSIGLPRTINGLTSRPHPPGPHLHLTADDSPQPAPIARIANPASRGRKAALKSDAAGKVPQRILPPTQAPALVPISSADFAATQLIEPPKEPERPKKKMTFPGFQSARGEGPWSREAFDLLESGRPV